MSERLFLAVRIWAAWARTVWLLRTRPLPDAVRDAGRVRTRTDSYPPASLGRAVHRALGIGRMRPRCLTQSVVFYSLLRAQGDTADVVIGLPDGSSRRAHAWIELDGACVGPPPGTLGSEVLARFA